MHTLILSCNTGEGHNSCAKAIQAEYAAHGESCEIVDALQFISKRASRFICDWHTRIYRHAPKLYRAGYRSVENLRLSGGHYCLSLSDLRRGAALSIHLPRRL